MQALLALLTLVLGLGLMGFMIATESEPGLLPLLLVVIGLGWYAATRFRARPRRT